jgi:1-acylglycerone phosphate reductase
MITSQSLTLRPAKQAAFAVATPDLAHFRSPMAANDSVLITRCSDNGIGSALALSFVQRSYHVFAASRNPASRPKLNNLDHVTLVKLDMEDSEQIASAIHAVRKEAYGSLRYLINNAGQNQFKPLLDENIEEAERLYQVNVFGPLIMVQAFAPLLIQGNGTVMFISSVSGHLNIPWQGWSYFSSILSSFLGR